MQLQEAFNLIWARAQTKERAYDSAGDLCKYRSDTGSACFVGVLIPDRLYHPGMEGCGVSELLNGFPALGSEIGHLEPHLRELQAIHDSMQPANWEKYLREFAVARNLTVPEAS